MSANPSSITQKSKQGSEVWKQRLATLAPVWTLLALIIFFSLTSNTFLRPVNLNNILAQVSTLAILSTGITFVLLTGQIDLSIAALVTVSGVVSAHVFDSLELAEPIPLIAALALTTVMGIISGVATTKFRIPSFMTTLAMSLIASGYAIWLSRGTIVFNISDLSLFLGGGRVGQIGDTPIKTLTVVAVIVLLLGHLVLRYTRLGRYVYMTGANPSAARLAGVNTDMTIIFVLALSGFAAGLAGIINMGRLTSAQPTVVDSFLIDAIGAVVLGGTSLFGGRGGIPQTVAGLLIYGTLRNGLDNIPQIDAFLKQLITGVVLLVALIANTLFSGESNRDAT